MIVLRARIAATFLLAALCAGCRGCPSRPEGAGVPEEIARQNIVGSAYLSQGEVAKAEAEFRAALAQRPEDPVLLVNLAISVLRGSQPEGAEPLLRQALARDPGLPQAHYVLALVEKDRGNFDVALELLDRVAQFDAEDVATQYQRGTVLSRLGRPKEAEVAFGAALRGNPDHVSSLYGLGRLLIQEGRVEDGERFLKQSQDVNARSGLDAAMGLQYGEQGPYAMAAEYPSGGLDAGREIPVTFLPDAALPSSESGGVAWTVGAIGAAAEPSAIVADARGVHALRGGAAPRLVTSAVAAGFNLLALAAGDTDGDGEIEVLSLGTGANPERDGLVVERLAPPGETIRLGTRPSTPPDAAHLVLVDADHDGDLDLFACWTGVVSSPEDASRCRLAVNDGSGRFAVAPRSVGLVLEPGASKGPISVGISDVDNDRDIDLLVVEPEGVRLFSNQRDGTFADASDASGLGARVRGAESLAVADLDKDSFMDLVLGTSAGPLVAWNRRGRFEAPRPLVVGTIEKTGAGGGRHAAIVLDADLDGFLDVAASGEGGPTLWRNLGLGRFSARKLGPESGFPVAALDADGDGDLDVLTIGGGSAATLLRNDGGNANRWIAIKPRGLRDNRFGIGTKVDVLAGALRQKLEVTAPLPVQAGLGPRPQADAVRLLWPGGVLQDEVGLPAGAVRETAQLDRKGTSCPLLYAWRDGRFRFVTDFMGGCAIGYRHAPGVLNVPDTDEYVLIEEGLTPESGELRLRFNNQLEEVLWFDQVQLVVADHPDTTELYPNERLMAEPPWPEFKVFISPNVRRIRAARDVASGLDVTERLVGRDRVTVDGFRLLPFKGYAEKHTLELDLGNLPAEERVVLLLDGWIDYSDSTANIAAFQAGVTLVPPVLLVPDRRRGWREAPGRMGFPAGLPKTMAVDLTGAVRPEDPRVRIETSMRIYWDRARVMIGGEASPVAVTRVLPRSAELRFGGFPAETSPDGKPPFAYDPEKVEKTSPWKAHAGAYTAFGDVTEALRSLDERFVTTRGGDEIELRFPEPPPPRAGFKRTYLLYADGFGKDMDPNSAACDEVGPIPFHGMPLYPYGVKVVPRATGPAGAPAARIVPRSADGLSGALPLPLAVREPRP